ncbi:MAG TPA: hypothetical protein VFS23_08595, partial [Vicinamibacterales bacterium]|nr:hypothetical protein [Vicinamibacterales bacterium]
GLLLLDDAPFVNTGPVQYIRLAGFLSLFSFVVSYHPRLFSALLSAASQRIQVRGADGPQSLSSDTSAAHATIDIERGKVDVAMAKRSGESDGSREPAGGSRATG